MKDEIARVLKTKWAGKTVHYYEETDSTNAQAKKLSDGADGAEHGTLVVADMQTAGRGRRGRAWDSPSGKNIYMSIVLKPEMPPDKAPMLTIVMAQSVAEAVREMTGADAYIKWPNDIVVNKKKVCGILTEMSTDANGIKHVIIGVGVNVNTETFPEELAETATSFRVEMGNTYDRAALVAGILERFEMHYETFAMTEDLSAIADRYNDYLINKNKEVRVLRPGQEYNGYALGINGTGELLVRREAGEIEKISSGEVSVRGIYGYV